MNTIEKYNMKEQDKKKLFSFNEVREIVRYYERIAKQDFADKVEDSGLIEHYFTEWKHLKKQEGLK